MANGKSGGKRLYYKIGEACKALDIQPYVLRYWETEFPALAPEKSRSGQRVYSERELALIRRIKTLLYDEGYTIAGAKKKLESELAGGTTLPFTPPDGPDDVAEEPGEATAAGLLDEGGDERLAGELRRLRRGVAAALAEAREILAILR